MSTRTELADYLRGVLPATWQVEPVTRSFDEPDPATPAIVAVETARMEPAPEQGAWVVKLHVWLLEPSLDIDAIDNNLEDHLILLIAAIDAAPGLTWEGADRGVYEDRYHAYKVEISTKTTKE